MDIITCKNCQQEISTSNVRCPHCGHVNHHISETQEFAGIAILVVALAAIFGGVYTACSGSDSESKATLVQSPPTPEQLRVREIAKAFDPWNGSHPTLEKFVRKNLNDPDSYQHIETKYLDKTDHIFVITKFRAKNAFGAFVVNTAAAKTNLDGSIIEADILPE
jgi:RNA polymerase subunit RPABC4/transcription elongation factor Spt4